MRYLELSQTIRLLAVTPPLRILGMIASPSDLQALDVEVERQRLERAITPLQDKGLVQLHWLAGATWRDLQRILRREAWHIFHFVGHGSFDPQRDEGVIAFCNDENKAHLLPASDLGRLLADQRTLRLAVLNACLGAQGNNRDLFSGVAATLVRRGIPAVVAMQQAVTDAAAIEFTQTFYESLADGLPVDAAMSEARKAISFALTNTVEWGTPVLYSRAGDGQIFTVASTDSATVERPPLAANLPYAPVNHSASPIVLDEERLAAQKAAAERAKKRVFQDDATVAPNKATNPSSTTQKRQWGKIIGGLAAVILVGYFGLLGVDSYQRNQRNIAATATQNAIDAAATAQALIVQATATALAQTVEAKMLQDAPQLRPLVERFNMRLVAVPAGAFIMGSPDGEGYDDEHPQFTMTVDALFWIGLTEVTKTQYQHFVDADGYNNQSWWTEAGWKWRTENNVTEPLFWNNNQWNGPNQPVVGVS